MRLRLWALLLLPATVDAAAIAIPNVTVVDVAAAMLRPNQTVVVEGARITVAGDAARVRVPAGARIVPGKGRFLIPGLWDMHVHDFWSPHVPELFLANGVTGVRDMYDDQAKIRDLRQAIREHRRDGPRVFASGAVLNGEREKNEQVVIRSAGQGREAVRQQVRDGVDFIKVYNALPRDAYFAIADECRRLRIPFVGHTPDAITTVEAAAAGQHSIEHLDGVLLDCSPLGAWLRRSHRFVPDRGMLDSFDPARADRLFATYVRYGTWHCPTLSYYRAVTVEDDPALVESDPDRQYLPMAWRPRPVKKPLSDPVLDRATQRKMTEITARMFRAGVRLLAGTDTGYPYVFPGFGLHRELELMVEGGLPPAAVLRIATLAPAEFFGRANELGTVAPGRIADLVMLDADPLQSIANTRLVRAVVADGRLYDRAALDRMLAAAGR